MAGTPHLGNGPQPLVVSGAPFAGHHPGQATDLAPTAITLPIQDLGRQLGQAGRSHSFGPWSLVALGQGHFGLLDFFIQSLQQIHPALEQLQYPGTDQLAQLAKGFRPPPILPTPVALAQ